MFYIDFYDEHVRFGIQKKIKVIKSKVNKTYQYFYDSISTNYTQAEINEGYVYYEESESNIYIVEFLKYNNGEYIKLDSDLLIFCEKTDELQSLIEVQILRLKNIVDTITLPTKP